MKRYLPMILGLAVIVIALIIIFASNPDNDSQEQNTDTNTTEENNDQADLNLDPDTKTFNSDKLGIRFRYDSKPSDTFEIAVTESDNKIYVHGTQEKPEDGKIIEVFNKSAGVSLEQAIKDQFLKNYSSENCYVTVDNNSDRADITTAIIDYPAPTDTNAPFWQNASKCPEYYAKTNAVQYFLHDRDIPTKYIFVKLGQDSITSDGTPVTEAGGRDWSASIEIVK